MITNIRIRNFKTLEDAEFKLGAAPVVLVGPNSCGKTSILQALTMWHYGVSEWCQRHNWRKRPGSDQPRGVGNPLKSFSALVAPEAKMIWRGQKIAESKIKGGRKVPIRIDVAGETTSGEPWDISAEFNHQGHNNIHCFPVVSGSKKREPNADIAKRWASVLPRMAFLQPMSGMSEEEDELRPGSIDDRLGKGKTADVLRNICYQLLHPDGNYGKDAMKRRREHWEKVKDIIAKKFFVRLGDPHPGPRGKILLTYREHGEDYDLSCGGRGFHQTLLLLAYLYSNPDSVVLLDEPDAHLEIVRQRDNFSIYSEAAGEIRSQLIIASHSEVVMNRASADGLVGVIGGKTTRLDINSIGVFRKLLSSVGWEKVMLAKMTGHIVFMEGHSDVEFLAAFAEKLFGDQAAEKFRRANVEQVGNVLNKAQALFQSLKSGVPELRGGALFDKDVDKKMQGEAAKEARRDGLRLHCWKRKEMENYLLLPDVLYRFAEAQDNLEMGESALSLSKHRTRAMREAVKQNPAPIDLQNPKREFWMDRPMSEYIEKILGDYYASVRGDDRLWHSRMYSLVQYMKPEEIPDEVREKILALLAVIDPDFDPENPAPEESE